jgi:hypothetical protein
MNTLAVHLERDRFICEFGFAVPAREALDWLAKYSPLLEIGAGSGAWAKLLAMRGADIIATDPGIESFSFGGERVRWETKYHPVLPLEGKTAVRRWPTRNVFCGWPSLSQTWLRLAARAMTPGRALYAVSELGGLWPDSVDDVSADQAVMCWRIIERLRATGQFPEGLRM